MMDLNDIKQAALFPSHHPPLVILTKVVLIIIIIVINWEELIIHDFSMYQGILGFTMPVLKPEFRQKSIVNENPLIYRNIEKNIHAFLWGFHRERGWCGIFHPHLSLPLVMFPLISPLFSLTPSSYLLTRELIKLYFPPVNCCHHVSGWCFVLSWIPTLITLLLKSHTHPFDAVLVAQWVFLHHPTY